MLFILKCCRALSQPFFFFFKSLLSQSNVCPRRHCRRRRPAQINTKIMQRLRRILSTLTLISICRFVSPNSPSRHYTISCILMHSHFFTKSPPYSPTPWLGSFCRNYRRNFRTFSRVEGGHAWRRLCSIRFIARNLWRQ